MNKNSNINNDVMEIAEKIVLRKMNEMKLIADQFYAKNDKERASHIDAGARELSLVLQGIRNNQGCW